jgi:hypothetical protein
MKRSVLPLTLVLIAAPFFGGFREEPLKFGLLQGVLIIAISVAAAGGLKPWRERLRSPAFAGFWTLLLGLGVAAPFLALFLKL